MDKAQRTLEHVVYTPDLVEQASLRIRHYAFSTPLLYSAALSKKTGMELYLKIECWQKCGSFKVRGIINFLSRLEGEGQHSQLVTASSGNHGLALTYISRLMGKGPVCVFMPQNAEKAKIQKLKLLGAETVCAGKDFFAALFVNDDKIVDAGTHQRISRVLKAQTTLGSSETLIIPGLVNAHSHGKRITDFQRGQIDDILEPGNGVPIRASFPTTIHCGPPCPSPGTREKGAVQGQADRRRGRISWHSRIRAISISPGR